MSTEQWVPTTAHWGAYQAAADGRGGVRVRPHPDDPAPSPLLGNVPGIARHDTRVLRPAVRRGWLTGGPGPSSRRGRDEFVEVDWDTALDLVAAQLDRVRHESGNEGIFGGSYGWGSAGRFHHAQSQLHRFLNTIGGYTASRNNYSFGTSQVLLPHVVGSSAAVLGYADSWARVREHTDLIVAFGGLPTKNLSVSPGGVTRHTSAAAAADPGMAVASISPLADDVPAGGRWYPIEPGTDVAMQLALAHTLLTEGLHDTEFLERCCTGFDVFAGYLLGESDGVPKTPEWAAGICGVDAADIRELARRMPTGRTLVTVTWSLQRTQGGEQPVWAGIALAAMLGQIGLPGGGFGHGYGSMADVGDEGPVLRLPTLSQGRNPVRSFIPVARIADMLLNPGATFDYDGQRLTYPDVRLVHWAGGNPFHHHQDLNRLRRAFARPETVVVHETHWTATARHADVVLPATTTLEREDLGAGRRDTHLTAMHRVLDPVGEARDDYSILAGLAERLGVRQRFTEGRSARGWLEHLYDGWREQLLAQGHELPDFDSFWAAGQLRLPEVPEDPPLVRFRRDPERERLHTPSGRIELYSAEVDSFGYDDCPGHPAWLPRERRGPLHLIANQPPTRLHGQGDVGAVSRESKVAGREPITLHPDDAAARGIAEGSVVRVFNERGACLAGARISDRVRPGVAVLPTGAWFDPQADPQRPGQDLCAHGNPNVLTEDVPASRLSQGCAGQRTHVDVELFTGPLPEVQAHTPPPLHPA
ncbi:molybdopterin-dependent oxidoreductase [Saccharopolyspora mangrovi]|uniref:Molybdopterin-dependent oxidoreductase n=1 Tax=Saccharopolyspora mangrovi TaxID=3082379 RepID=A0ABU6AKK0_9PSEU|nr:molybdopterin-dependent oxidoreductase [Saccharopolyspora sp. S2-29]MEB3372099.1 molybdopterin-dependent oxidoreductase [Saccharopolyspora sp. S2-29]